MLNLRSIVLASAILLSLAVGVMADPQQDVYNAGADVFAHVDGVKVLEPNVYVDPVNHRLANERLVEGHTTFVTMDAHVTPHQIEGNASVTGFVNCQYHTGVTDSGYLAIIPTPFGDVSVPYPTGTEPTYVECHAGDQIIITPKLSCQFQNNWGCTSSSIPYFFSTNRQVPYVTPLTEQGWLQEYSFQDELPDGSGTKTNYAWAVTIMSPWLDADGQIRNFVAPIPLDTLHENAADHYYFLHADAVRRG